MRFGSGGRQAKPDGPAAQPFGTQPDRSADARLSRQEATENTA